MYLTPFPEGESQLPNHHLLRPHVISIDEAYHIHPGRDMDGFADAAVDLLAAQDAAIHVNDLQGSFTGS
jgi:hypothetical protein